MKRIRRILHPTDFSSASRPALTQAVDVARMTGARLTLLHVMGPVIPIAGEGYIPPQTWTDLERQMRGRAQRDLDRLVARVRKARVRADTLVVEGTPADRIVRAARARRADLIVMGTHGRGALAKLFLGSVAERVIGTAPCPVLTVRAR